MGFLPTAMEESIDVMIYEWTYLEPNLIVGFGLRNNTTVAIVVEGFRPYFYSPGGDLLSSVIDVWKSKSFTLPDMKYLKKRLLRGAYLLSEPDKIVELRFEDMEMMKRFAKSCREKGLEIYEDDTSFEEQFLNEKDLNVTGWIRVVPRRTEHRRRKITSLEEEYFCSTKDLTSIVGRDQGRPLILCMDIEAYSSKKNMMPNPDIELDVAFMISVVAWRYKETEVKRYILHCCGANVILNDVETRAFVSENDMIKGYFYLINEINPDVITGYNIFKFDFEYIPCRLKRKIMSIPNTSRIIGGKTEEKETRWHSSAYGYNDYLILDAKGRCVFDLYQYVSREYRLPGYSLSSVAKRFVGDDKIDMDYRTIFSLYLKGDDVSITLIAEYCLHDSILVKELFDKMDVWITLVELSKVTGVSIKDLYTRGQQVRVLSQLRKECWRSNILMNKPNNTTRSDYEGAYVVTPIPGIYRWCFSLDFSSLYPSIIIGYNICYSTFVSEETFPFLHQILDQDCHVIEVAPGRTYRFLKHPQGVVPRLLKRLIDERNLTKQKIREIKDGDLNGPQKIVARTVLDKRQWALKISANSVYGSYGTRNEGYLQFMQGAECTTATGRKNIHHAMEIIEKNYSTKVIYGDTDSCIVLLPDEFVSVGTSVAQIAKVGTIFAKKMAEEVSAQFPPPLRLEFENIYESFLIASKKRYAGLVVDTEGNSKLVFKGLVPARRDRCNFLRSSYEEVLEMILRGKGEIEVHSFLRKRLFSLLIGNVKMEDMMIRRSLSNSYKISSNPQLVFANRLRDRGEMVEPGSRLEFVFVKRPEARLQGEKMELVDEATLENLDIHYYLERHVAPPLDDLLSTAGMNTFVLQFNEYMKYLS